MLYNRQSNAIAKPFRAGIWLMNLSLTLALWTVLLTLGCGAAAAPEVEQAAEAPAPAAPGQTGAPPRIAGCPIFPADNIWNTPIDRLPRAASSGAYVAAIGAAEPLKADFGAGLWQGGPIGIPFAVVASDQAGAAVTFDYDDESDPGPYPIPPDPPIEGGPQSDSDRHILLLARESCRLYELFDAWPQPDGSWHAGSGAIFDLNSHALRPAGWTSADAAGLPILPGLVRYDEVASGAINHALRFTAPQTRRAYVWPGRHYASDLTAAHLPPMGQRFRLRAGFDIAPFPPELQVILRALKKYGMFLADNGSPWFLSGVPDERWDNELLQALKQVRGADFEAVDLSSLQVDADSGQARLAAPGEPAAFLPALPVRMALQNRLIRPAANHSRR